MTSTLLKQLAFIAVNILLIGSYITNPVIESYLNGFNKDVYLTLIIASVVLVFIWLLIFFRSKWWSLGLMIFLILSLTPFLNFSHFQYYLIVGSVNIKLLNLACLIVHLVFNRDIIKNIILFFQSDPTEVKQKKEALQKKYLVQFADKNQSDLTNISYSSDYTPEAQWAAQQILNQKNHG